MYPVKSTLYVNGVSVAERHENLQVVASANAGTSYAMTAPGLIQ
ncbi:hypothetical protein PAMC26577_11965 [Caballeronia sordidicola]|uniref:Uncharacterized protein n=2 Tax=Caballeronia sordidicola TaxID=196367 RepID=A0A242MXG0_CABSO|nr:hypothetical protein PAMC26577_11965 [Caballeronia sordidicola]